MVKYNNIKNTGNIMGRTSNVIRVIKTAVNNYVELKNSEVQMYQHRKHILTKDSEITVPSEQEIYIFDKDAWNINTDKDCITLIKKE